MGTQVNRREFFKIGAAATAGALMIPATAAEPTLAEARVNPGGQDWISGHVEYQFARSPALDVPPSEPWRREAPQLTPELPVLWCRTRVLRKWPNMSGFHVPSSFERPRVMGLLREFPEA